jgi:hypothetical protein
MTAAIASHHQQQQQQQQAYQDRVAVLQQLGQHPGASEAAAILLSQAQLDYEQSQAAAPATLEGLAAAAAAAAAAAGLQPGFLQPGFLQGQDPPPLSTGFPAGLGNGALEAAAAPPPPLSVPHGAVDPVATLRQQLASISASLGIAGPAAGAAPVHAPPAAAAAHSLLPADTAAGYSAGDELGGRAAKRARVGDEARSSPAAAEVLAAHLAAAAAAANTNLHGVHADATGEQHAAAITAAMAAAGEDDAARARLAAIQLLGSSIAGQDGQEVSVAAAVHGDAQQVLAGMQVADAAPAAAADAADSMQLDAAPDPAAEAVGQLGAEGNGGDVVAGEKKG